jgi:hypothetical protein
LKCLLYFNGNGGQSRQNAEGLVQYCAVGLCNSDIYESLYLISFDL